MELRVLFIEDDESLRENLKKSFSGASMGGYTLSVEAADTFEKSLEVIKKSDFDIIVLDLYKDQKGAVDENAGVKVLDEIRKLVFVPVIFYTGHPHKIQDLISEIVGVVSKGDGIKKLSSELERIITSRIALLKKHINTHIKEQLREYFWDTVDSGKKIFTPSQNDFSFGYLLLRRLANSLSKENIKKLLGDSKIKIDKAHPMEFYIYPSKGPEYEAGEILSKDGKYYAILTPTCDFVSDGGRPRKVGQVLLGIASPLKETEIFKKYSTNKEKYKQSLSELIESRKGDRYFFLPGTPFIDNLVLDFQTKIMIPYDGLASYKRIAKLDDPFAQSMTSSFIRYYNRIGFPDIDSDYVLSKL